MTSLLISNHNAYTNTHEAFKLKNLAKWAELFGVDFFIRCSDTTPKLDHPRIYYTDATDNDGVIIDLQKVLSKLKPIKVVNLVEGFFPWDMVDTSAIKIYFVRSCAAKILDIIKGIEENTPGWIDAAHLYTKRAEREKRYIESSNVVITDSPNSQHTVCQYYNITPEVCLEYVNPELYRLPAPSNETLVYNVGRTDLIKGLHWVAQSPYHRFISIGNHELGSYSFVANHMQLYGFMSQEHYVNLISDAVFGIFPALWESNGYAVQECLAMGKIPVVQDNSGGNLRLLSSDNSVIVDFAQGQGRWWEKTTDLDICNMSQNARDTLTHSMYLKSLEKFGDAIC